MKKEILIELKKLISPESENTIWHSEEIWARDPEISNYVFSKMNYCTNQLILAIENNSSEWKLKKILKNNLRSFRRIDFDTEDAEFITECFEFLASIMGIKFGDNLMRWLYGIPIWLLMKIVRFFRPEKIIAVKKQACTKCKAELRMELKQKGSGRDSDWIIGKCLGCNEYNLLESFADSKKTTFSNFYPSEHLSKDEHNEEQANIRLEQIRYWRK